MKKLSVICVMVLVALGGFAQQAQPSDQTAQPAPQPSDQPAQPAPQPAQPAAKQAQPANEIYGTVWLDWDGAGYRFTNTSTFPLTVSDFSFNRLRFGIRNTLAGNVKTWFEWDPRNLEFRQVNADWSPFSNFDLIIGKQSKLFAQVDDWIFSDRTVGIQARYALPGMGWAGVIVGNTADITNFSSKKLGFESGMASVPITAVSEVNPSYFMIYPQLTVKPDLGKDIGLEIGANAEITVDKIASPNTSGTSIDGYLIVSAYGASLAAEFTYTNVNDTTTGNRDMVLYTRAAYNAGFVTPTAYFVVDNVTGTNNVKIGTFANSSTPNATFMLELPFNATKDLIIDPFFSYGVSGYNLQEYYIQGLSTSQTTSFPYNDWVVGLRVKYAISAKF